MEKDSGLKRGPQPKVAEELKVQVSVWVKLKDKIKVQALIDAVALPYRS